MPQKSPRRAGAGAAWRKEQTKDRYFQAAKESGYRARSAFKLLQIDRRFKVLKPGATVVDLGAAPGSWSQVAAAAVGPRGRVFAVDLSAIEPLPGVETLQADLLARETPARIRAALGRDADVVLSDAAPQTTGIKVADHLRSVVLAEAALAVAVAVLRPGGDFVAKVFRGSDFDGFVADAKRRFRTVKVNVPAATRQESTEAYIIGLDFKGRPAGRPGETAVTAEPPAETERQDARPSLTEHPEPPREV